LFCYFAGPYGSGWYRAGSFKNDPNLFAIAMSGFGMNADTARSREAGFRHHLLKPFRTAELDRVLAEASSQLV
jgi:CheY-like chemotaxis protein